MTKADKRGMYPLARQDVARLRAIVDASEGVSGAAKRLDLPRSTIASALAGIGLREGTVMLIRSRLESAEATS